MRTEGVNKFYFSHLNYAGRGNIHRARDAQFQATRDALDLLFETALTLQEIKRLPMSKPIGKYNVWNKINRSEGISH